LIPAIFGQKEQIKYMPHWLPQAQFAGYYIALKNGFYETEGLDVEIIHPSPTDNVIELLNKGDVDIISSFLMTAIKYHSQGYDLVNFCQLSQNCGQLFVSKKKSNITTPADLNGKKIGIWNAGFDEIPLAFIRDKGCNVEWVPVLTSVDLFLLDGIDVSTVMWYNEYNQIINSGINEDELNTFFFSDFGYNIPEDGLYCLKETHNNKSQALRKFINATLKGWEYAFENQDETINLVMEKMKIAHVPTNRAQQEWMLEKMQELFSLKQKPISKGVLYKEDYINAFELLQSHGKIDKNTKPDYESFYIK
ncbi:ABC transporter substrate-binding protein, partial [Bacteroidota bacterium]